MSALKAVVLALVLANLGYLLWTHGIADEEAGGGSVPPAPSIKLATETPGATHGSSAEVLRQASADGVGSQGAPVMGAEDHVASDDQSAALLTHVRRCVSIGPFHDVAEAVRAATSLRGTGFAPRQRVAEGEVPAGVWVYVPKPEDALAAEQLLSRLKQAGIEDALEMPGPDETPAISLGLFSDPKRGQSRFEQARALGLKPVIADRKRSASVYWVDVDLKPTDAMPSPADLQHGGGNRILRLEVKACPAA
ncbi:MAG: hypothetical protein JSS24_06865 [Proteobacteria bacterium]|nr:hypothetical protein [Pseudomonadota bacterium]